jgi:outer membrane immunogenic protein
LQWSPPAGRANAQWTGFSVGANAGGAMAEVTTHNNVDFSNTGYFALSSTGSIDGSGRQRLSPSGFTGGGQGGFNWQIGSWVVGIEGDIDVMSTKDTGA